MMRYCQVMFQAMMQWESRIPAHKKVEPPSDADIADLLHTGGCGSTISESWANDKGGTGHAGDKKSRARGEHGIPRSTAANSGGVVEFPVSQHSLLRIVRRSADPDRTIDRAEAHQGRRAANVHRSLPVPGFRGRVAATCRQIAGEWAVAAGLNVYS